MSNNLLQKKIFFNVNLYLFGYLKKIKIYDEKNFKHNHNILAYHCSI